MKLTGRLFSGDVQLQLPETFVAKLTTVMLGSDAASVTDEDAGTLLVSFATCWRAGSLRLSLRQVTPAF